MGSRIEEFATARFRFYESWARAELGTCRGKNWTRCLEADLRHPQQDAYPLPTGNRTFILELNGKLTRGKIEKGFDLPSSTHFLKLQVKGDTLNGQGVGAFAIRLIQQNYIAGTLLEINHFQKPCIDSCYVFLSLVIMTARHRLLKHLPCLDRIKQIVSIPLKLTPNLSVGEARAIDLSLTIYVKGVNTNYSQEYITNSFRDLFYHDTAVSVAFGHANKDPTCKHRCTAFIICYTIATYTSCQKFQVHGRVLPTPQLNRLSRTLRNSTVYGHRH